MEHIKSTLAAAQKVLEIVMNQLNEEEAKETDVPYLYGYDLKSCPNKLLEKWREENTGISDLVANLQVTRELQRREILHIEIIKKEMTEVK